MVVVGNIITVAIGCIISGFWGFLVAGKNPKSVTEQNWFIPVLLLFTAGAASWVFLFAPSTRIIPNFWGAMLLLGLPPIIFGMIIGAAKKRNLS